MQSRSEIRICADIIFGVEGSGTFKKIDILVIGSVKISLLKEIAIFKSSGNFTAVGCGLCKQESGLCALLMIWIRSKKARKERDGGIIFHHGPVRQSRLKLRRGSRFRSRIFFQQEFVRQYRIVVFFRCQI